MVDDVIEFGGASAHKYIPQMIPIFLHNFHSTNHILRQCSTYGLAQSLRYAPTICMNYLPTIVPALMDFVNNSNKLLREEEKEDNEGAIENAIYALGK